MNEEQLRWFELRRLHAQYNELTEGRLGYNAAWTSLYTDALHLSPLLRASMATVYLIHSAEEKVLAEDLVIHGKDSTTYKRLRSFWEGVLMGMVQWDVKDRHYIYPDDSLYTWAGNFPTHVKKPEDVAMFIAAHPLRRDLSPFVQGFLKKIHGDQFREEHYPVIDAWIDYILEEQELLEPTGIALPDSSLSFLLSALEFGTEERLEDFFSLATEYNLEWALASFEWGEGEPPLLSQLQRFVDASPWSD